MQITIENYEEERKKLAEWNSYLQGVVLRDAERCADEYLKTLKAQYAAACSGSIPYEMPTLLDKTIHESALYRFCDAMPKGAELHVHDMALLPAEELIRLLRTCPEFCINGDRISYNLITVAPGEPVPRGYLPFAEAVDTGYYSEEELVYNWTTESAAASGKNVWAYFEELFTRHAVLSDNPSFAEKYYDYAFRYCIRRGILHVEIHLMLTESPEASSEYVKAVRRAYYRVRGDYPYFTLRIIGAGAKSDTEKIEFTKRCFLNASFVQETVKDEWDPQKPKNLIIGFDLVNEEDTSLPLKAFAPMLLKVKRQYPDMKLYIHGGESIDAGNENLIDAYLLGVSRVGHGLNLHRYPDLHARYVKAEICLEVCPISNQRLGYTRDL